MGTILNQLSTQKIIIISFLCLIIAHLVIQSYFPSFTLNAIGFLLLFVIVWSKSLSKHDHFGFVMIIYFLSHFAGYADAQGGAFNLLAFSLLVFYKISYKETHAIKIKEPSMNILLLILILSNIFGWIIKNEMPISTRIPGIISFFGYLLMFDITRKLEFTPDRIKTFLKVSIIVISYSFLSSLNKLFRIYRTDLPIFGGTLNFGSDNVGGIIGYSPISGEIGLLMFTFIMPFYLTKASNNNLINKKFLLFGLGIMVLTVIVSNSRSVNILLGIAFLIFSFLANIRIIESIRNIKFISISAIAILLLILFVAPQLNLLKVEGRFNELSIEEMDFSSLITGKGINRTVAFELGAKMLVRENWWIGYGWGTLSSNRIAWFGDENFYRLDPHSLFLSLPMLFGWFGTIVFYLLILFTMYRLYKIISKNNRTLDFIIIPSLGFFMLFIFFLTNEIKTTVLSQPHYFMIFWIWLGFANSVINNSTKLKSTAA